MRTTLIITATLLLLTAGCSSSHGTADHRVPAGSGQSAAATKSAAGTNQSVIRPVDSAGQPAAGFTVTAETDQQLICTPAQPSSVSVSAHVAYCLPGALYAVACWASADGADALCYRDAWSHTLYRIPTGAGLDTSALAAPATPAPMALLLADGDHCMVRDLGAWSSPAQHPDWVGYYSCTRDGAVWAPRQASATSGVDRSQPDWTVQVASMSGAGRFSTQRVVTAYFVGTVGGT